MARSSFSTPLLVVWLIFVVNVLARSQTHKSDAAQTTVATVDFTFKPFPTNFDTIVTTTVDHPALDPTATGAVVFYPLIQNYDVEESLSFNINITSDTNDVAAYCWYPISGNWGLLPRVLFYVTICAALVLRHHQWLYAGALVASLTYSGTAAIQACLMVWRGPSFGDLDMIPLLAILGTSCALTVPLLNWSETLRNIGKNENEIDPGEKQAIRGKLGSKQSGDQEFGSAARLIVLYWGFLVIVGFLCVFVAVVPLSFSSTAFHNWAPLTLAGGNSISCTPQSGQLDLSAGQAPDWDELYLTTEFIDTNGCTNPCSIPDSDGLAIFRSPQDLATIDFESTLRFVLESEKNTRERNNDRFVYYYNKYGLLMLPYILLQGIWATIFGRRTPAQARNIVYAVITRVRFSRKRTPLDPAPRGQKAVAKYLAFLSYLWAVFILFVSAPIVILNVCAAEIYMFHLAASETNTHIGAWSTWISVALTLVAALLARYHQHIGYILALSCFKAYWLFVHPTWLFLQLCGYGRRDRSKAKNILSGEFEEMPDRNLYRETAGHVFKPVFNGSIFFVARHFKSASHGIRDEWRQLKEFLRNPDLSRNNQGRVHRLQATECGCIFGCKCPPGLIQPQCKHEKGICLFYKECPHSSQPCVHTQECMEAKKQAQRLRLLNPERMTIAMALGPLHGGKLELDVTGTPIPLRPQNDPPRSAFFSQKPLADSDSEADERAGNSVVAIPRWNDSTHGGETPAYHTSIQRMFSRKSRYSRVDPPRQDSTVESTGEMSTMVHSSPTPVFPDEASRGLVPNKATGFVRVSEDVIHPLLRDSFVSQDPAYHIEQDPKLSLPPRAVVTNEADVSRRKSMAKDLPALPRGPPKTPHPTPNYDNHSLASGVSAVSAGVSHVAEPTLYSQGENVSPIRPSTHGTTQDSSGNVTKRSVDASPVEHYGPQLEPEPRRTRTSSGLTSSFEQGIMSRQRRSQAYGPDIPRDRDAQTSSSSAPIPVHMEESSDDEDEMATEVELPAVHTPADAAVFMPPFSDGEDRNPAQTAETREIEHVASEPLQPRPLRHIAELARIPLTSRDSAGAFLSPQEKHALLDPPSTSSTPPITLPPLSPPDPLSNVARASSLLLQSRNPRLSLSGAMHTPYRFSGGSLEGPASAAEAPRSTGPAMLEVGHSSVPEGLARIESSVQRVKSPRPTGYRSTVDYLQVHRPSTMMYADEITLRKDEYGVYQLVVNGREIVHPRSDEKEEEAQEKKRNEQ